MLINFFFNFDLTTLVMWFSENKNKPPGTRISLTGNVLLRRRASWD